MKSPICLIIISALVANHMLFAQETPTAQLEQSVQTPGFGNNIQETCVCFDNKSLTGLLEFNVHISVFPQDKKLMQKLDKLIEDKLQTIGEVVILKNLDMRGFGCGSAICIHIGNVRNPDYKDLPLSRISLEVSTSVVLSKTGRKEYAEICSINDFYKGFLDIKSEKLILNRMQKVMNEFVRGYSEVNMNQQNKPIFYIYRFEPTQLKN